ncbi:MAG: peptidoglycan editing factor PgeF [Holosporales bacterium]|jgi:YfiH family protein|nr:peptidoglycan editing factor PgeF [Holosporales bacterium]
MLRAKYADTLSNIPLIKHGFFGKEGGESVSQFESLNVGLGRGDDDKIVMKNRAKISEYFGILPENMVIPKQIHSNFVEIVDNPLLHIECDSVITNTPNLLIGVTTADCVPILLCDVKQRYIAAIHSGWRGALLGVVENTLANLKKLGCRGDNIVAAIGPCIHQESFEVGSDVIDMVDKKYIDTRQHFDLLGYVRDKLIESGVLNSNISKIDIDTFKNNEYFSYRRANCRGCGVQFSGIMIV